MNKLYIFLIILGIFFVASNAFATVGGPTYISEIALDNPESNVIKSVYYKLHDGGGRGCPPIIHKIGLVSLTDSEVRSCDQAEQDGAKYPQFVSDTYQNLSYLGSVSLKKNNIDIRVEFISENKLEGFDDPVSNNFLATLAQDGTKFGEINFKGCARDQPHVFEGYMIPNSNSMAILISNKGDCFEGGYVKESLSVVKGIKYLDKNIVRSFKTASATEPNSGNMIVYATTSETTKPDMKAPTENNNSIKNNNNNLYIAVIIIGLGLGYFFGRKTKK